MKKLFTSISPFLMLLIPVFFLSAFFFSNNHADPQAANPVKDFTLQFPAITRVIFKTLL